MNVCVLVLRKQPVGHGHFRTPIALPVIGAITCLYLVFPWTSGRSQGQYGIALALLAIGIVLWAVTRLGTRAAGRREGTRSTEATRSSGR